MNDVKYLMIILMLACYFARGLSMEKNQGIIKILRIGKVLGSLDVLYGPEFEKDPNYEYGGGEFLFDLHWVIEDAGIYILFDFGTYTPNVLEKKINRFGGNVTCADVTENNKVIITDYYKSWQHEMDLDEFLRINEEYHKMEQADVDEIVFKRVGDKVTLQGIWHNKKTELEK